MKVLVFGEILWDLIDEMPHLGGAPFNFAAHLVRCGGEATLVSAVGNDELGRRALKEARNLEVHTQFISVDRERPTGTVDVFLTNGEPDYHITKDVAFDRIELNEKLFEAQFDTFYFGTLARRQHFSEQTFQNIVMSMKFRNIFYDVNLRKNCWTPRLLHVSLSLCTILKLNRGEVATVGRSVFVEDLEPLDFCLTVTKRYEQIKTIVITDGENGCMVYSHGRFDHIPGHKVKVVDAIGAGDAFSAVFMCVLGQSGNPWYAAAAANRIGAFVASQRGAIPDYDDDIKTIIGDLRNSA